MKTALVAVFAMCLLAQAMATEKQTGPPVAPPSGPIKTQKKLIDSPLDDIQWVTTKVVYVLSEQGQLYRSEDAGVSWTNQASKLRAATANPSVRSVHVSLANPNYIFFMGHGAENWVTFDMGKTYQPTGQVDLHEVRLHPRQSKWLLGAGMSHGCDQSPKKHCYKVLYYSTDFGSTWKQATTYVVQFDWGPTIVSVKSRPTHDHDDAVKKFAKYKDPAREQHDHLIWATIHKHKEGNQRFGAWDKNIHLYQSFDYFKTHVVVVKHGNRFLFGEHNYLFVAAVNPYQETEVSLQVSSSRDAVKKHFRTAVLPVELTEHSYTILDTSEGSVFLHVNHAPFDQNAPTGHVYISGASGVLYSLSLPFNHRSPDGKCDFEKVEGLEGIYVANFIDETDEENDVEIWDDTLNDGMGGAGNKHKRAKAKTVITFDKGAVWSYLEPPSLDSKGNRIKCPGCHLHLHGVTDLYGPTYTSASATGIIMATGTVGAYLQESLDHINTYLSRDAGLSWYEVAKGSHIYEFGDHGGLIVMAYDEGETDSILYSWNQGVDWLSHKISEAPLQVENIIIEPEAVSQRFIVYGWQDENGVLITIDFSELHQRVCQGHDAPDSKASDYELWTPSDGRLGGKCLMGHKITYTRRKREAQCFNPIKHERHSAMEHCPCNEEDFECDYGYYRKIDGGECIKDPDAEPLPKEACHSTYHVTKGYRRIAGNTCKGGEKWDRVEASCSVWHGSHMGKFALLVFFVVVASLAVVSCYNKSEFVEDLMDSIRAKFTGGRSDYWEIGKRMPHSMADDDFGLDDNEYSQSAHLMSHGRGDDLEEEDDHSSLLQPLPDKPRNRGAVPALDGPDEFA